MLRDKEAAFSIRNIVWVWYVESVYSTCIVSSLPFNGALVDICDPFTPKYLDGLVHFGNWSFKIVDIMGDASTASIDNTYFVLIGVKFGNIVMSYSPSEFMDTIATTSFAITVFNNGLGLRFQVQRPGSNSTSLPAFLSICAANCWVFLSWCPIFWRSLYSRHFFSWFRI